MEKGIYCLVISHGACKITVGSLGDLAFNDGWHVYTGSAQGPGGLGRVSRHIRVAAAPGGKLHWHIDYLLNNPAITLCYAISAKTNRPLECQLARLLGGIPVAGFGCSDCSCLSHLFYFEKSPEKTVISTMQLLGLDPDIARINTLQ
jgi:Uri superfamily endonuclease